MKQVIVDNEVTNYLISNKGECLNTKTGKFLKGQISNSGYLNYNLTFENGERKRFYAHRLVAFAYLENDDKDKTQVNHIDGNKLNNSVENLEWCTPKENTNHAIDTGLWKPKINPIYCFNEDMELVEIYESIMDAARKTGFQPTMINQEVLKNDNKSLTYGFYWSYENRIYSVKNVEKNLSFSPKAVCQYTKEGDFVKEFTSMKEAAKSVGSKSHSHIGECCRGKIKTYKGFVWKYKEDIV